MTEPSPLIGIRPNCRTCAVTFAANGKYLVSGDEEGVQMWRVKDGTQMTRMAANLGVRCLAVSKNDGWIAAGTYPGGVSVWDAKTHKKVFSHEDGTIHGVDFSPDSTRLVTASLDRTASVWDVATGKRALGPLRHEDYVIVAKYSPQGDRIATRTLRCVRVYDSSDGSLLVDIPLGETPYYNKGLLWSGDHLFILSNNKIKQVEASTGSTISEWPVPNVHSWSGIALPQYGNFIACFTKRTVMFWDMLTHTHLGLIQHSEDIYSIAFSSDDRILAIGGGQKISIHSISLITAPDIQIDDAVLDSWKCGQLVNAETLLTVAMPLSLSLAHHVLASRSLIRARLRQWDTAIDDSEQSIEIEPSVIGYIAKSVALVGKGEKEKGYRACDVAFERFRLTHVSFLLLIKAVIIFMAGHHDDAISRVDDLIAMVHFNSVCSVVQAYMYYLLGNLQMDRKDYEDALQSFERARTRMRHHNSQSLVVISLISGWKFDQLDVVIRQRLCEALYAAGRTKKGAESLLEMLGTLDKEVYMSEPTVNWISDFTQRCLSTGCSVNPASVEIQHNKELSTPTPLLREWARSTLAGSSWENALNAAVGFTAPRIVIYRAICERLDMVDRTLDASECLHQMSSELAVEMGTHHEHAQWVLEFRLRCCERLDHFGDEAMVAQRHDVAIAQFSAALSLYPDSPQYFFIKRSKARAAKGLWDDALNDVNEAISRDPSSPWGYEAKHAVLHEAKCYVDAVDAFETMFSNVAQSPDPKVRESCGQYISPLNTRTKIRKIVQRTICRSPRVLINTTTGRLQSRAEQASSFESSPVFSELLSSMTRHIDRDRIKSEVRQFFRYVMLSHKWEENEPLFQQVIHVAVYDLDQSPTHDKLQMFCKIVRDAGFNWAWSDTCCIDKQDHFVLQEALVAMFKWYHNSAMVMVYLRGVRSPAKLGDLVSSIWNTRAWTFQEYVAAKVVHFYTEDWKLYLNLEMPNHKESPEIISEMEQVTGVSAAQLMALSLGLNNIREKLCLASKRQTTLVEDAAYSLLGIFSVTGILPNYGEGENAVGRLLAHILSSSGDASILAWTGQSSSVNSCLPARIIVYSRPATLHVPLRIADAEMKRAVNRLRDPAFDLDLAIRLYNRLNELPTPWFAANRLKLPCIAFKLPPLLPHQTSSGSVYRTETSAFGTVEIKTRRGLSHMKYLYLVHPWLDNLFGREDTHVGAAVEDELAALSSPGADDEDTDDEGSSKEAIENDRSPLPEPRLPLPPAPTDTDPLDRETQALQLIARLRQPFGALLFTLALTGRRAVEYRRIAADSVITVQVQETIPLDELLENVRILDVL